MPISKAQSKKNAQVFVPRKFRNSKLFAQKKATAPETTSASVIFVNTRFITLLTVVTKLPL
jgi:hypothetical protein